MGSSKQEKGRSILKMGSSKQEKGRSILKMGSQWVDQF